MVLGSGGPPRFYRFRPGDPRSFLRTRATRAQNRSTVLTDS